MELAVLDTSTTTALKALREQLDLTFEAILDASAMTKRQKSRKYLNGTLAVSVNIYGPKDTETSDVVGKRLSDAAAYLQHPRALPPLMEYCNPQFLSFPGEQADMTSLVGISNDSPWARKVRILDEANDILMNLAEVDESIVCQSSPIGLKSELKSYVTWLETLRHSF